MEGLEVEIIEEVEIVRVQIGIRLEEMEEVEIIREKWGILRVEIIEFKNQDYQK